MATYKLIQDIEAEDHILGPLSFRQFVFALIAVFFGYMTFIVITKGVGILALLFAPPALFFGFFALPFGRDQPTEIWALAKLRFLLKPRKRIWDQSGAKELVTITAPKKIERVYTDGLSQTEVKSRLSALANTLDSRGWAIKNTDAAQPDIVANSDRLMGLSVETQEVPDIDVRASDDVLDNTASPLAQQFTDMIDASSHAHRQELIDKLNNIRTTQTTQAPAQPQNNWFMPTGATSESQRTENNYQPPQVSGTSPTAQAETPEELAVAAQLQAKQAAQQASYSNMRTVQPVAASNPQVANSPQQTPVQSAIQAPAPSVTPAPDPAILSLATNNDLNIATLARQADKTVGGASDEVVVSLH